MTGATKAAKEPLCTEEVDSQESEKIRKLREVSMELRAHARHVNKLAVLLDDLSYLLSVKDKT